MGTKNAAWQGWDGMEGEPPDCRRASRGKRSLPASEVMENLQGREMCIKAVPR